MKKKHILLYGFLIVLALAMAVGFAAILLPDNYVDEEVIVTILLVGGFAVGGLIVLAVGREMRLTTLLALIVSGISLVCFLALTWFEGDMHYETEEFILKCAVSTLIAAFVFTHRLLIVPLDERNTWGTLSKRVALVGAGVTASFIICLLILESFWGWEDIMVRIMGVGLLLTAGSSISTGAISMFGPKPGEDEPDVVAQSILVNLTCPSCTNPIEVSSNRAGHCGFCKLQIEVRTAELRCECGYLLHQLEADICPECGKSVEAGESWRRGQQPAVTDTPHQTP